MRDERKREEKGSEENDTLNNTPLTFPHISPFFFLSSLLMLMLVVVEGGGGRGGEARGGRDRGDEGEKEKTERKERQKMTKKKIRSPLYFPPFLPSLAFPLDSRGGGGRRREWRKGTMRER